MLSRFTVLLMLISVWFSSSVYAANDNWFDVEIYVFSRQSHTSEQWPETVSLANTQGAIDMITPLVSTDISGVNSGINACNSEDWINRPDWCNQQMLQTSTTFPSVLPIDVTPATATQPLVGENTVLLPNTSFQFNQMIDKLTKQPGIQGLLHMSWRQNMLPKTQTQPIRLIAGEDFSKQYQNDGSEIITDDTSITNVTFINTLLMPTATQTKPLWQLDGTLDIYLDHYLYIETDLVLRKQGIKSVTAPLINSFGVNTNNSSSIIGQDQQMKQLTYPFLYAIHMLQNRRVRSDEIHYFDHPELGLIIQIRKIK